MFRGVGLINAPYDTGFFYFICFLLHFSDIVKSMYADYSQWKNWYSQFKEHKIIEQIDPNACIERVVYSSPGGASDRDFIQMSVTEENDGGYLNVQMSIEDSRVPPCSGCVRADTQLTATLIQKVSDSQTKMTYVRQVDLGGYLPGFLRNMISSKQPMCIAMLRDCVLKQTKSSS